MILVDAMPDYRQEGSHYHIHPPLPADCGVPIVIIICVVELLNLARFQYST